MRKNRKIGVRNFIPPFRFTFTLNLKSTHPQRTWKNILHYGNVDWERGLAVWLYPTSPNHGLFSALNCFCFTLLLSSGGRLHIRVDQTRQNNDGCDPVPIIHINQPTKIEILVGKKFMGKTLRPVRDCSNKIYFPTESKTFCAFFGLHGSLLQ